MPPEDLVHPPQLLPGRYDLVEDHEEVDVRVGVGIAARPRAEQDDVTEARAIQRPEGFSHGLGDLDARNSPLITEQGTRRYGVIV
jgi:hypothetical protein